MYKVLKLGFKSVDEWYFFVTTATGQKRARWIPCYTPYCIFMTLQKRENKMGNLHKVKQKRGNKLRGEG